MTTPKEFVESNSRDLTALGLLFARLLYAEICARGTEPSPIFVAVSALADRELIGNRKNMSALLRELGQTGMPILHDGGGKSVLSLGLSPLLL